MPADPLVAETVGRGSPRAGESGTGVCELVMDSRGIAGFVFVSTDPAASDAAGPVKPADGPAVATGCVGVAVDIVSELVGVVLVGRTGDTAAACEGTLAEAVA